MLLAPASVEQGRGAEGAHGERWLMESRMLDETATIGEEDEASGRDLQAGSASLEERFLQCQSETRGEFSALRHEVHRLAETLRIEIRAGDAETRRYMRVLHEEVLSRIASIYRR
jgi:hypothetical protein